MLKVAIYVYVYIRIMVSYFENKYFHSNSKPNLVYSIGLAHACKFSIAKTSRTLKYITHIVMIYSQDRL